MVSISTSTSTLALPLPDVLFHGVVLRNNEPLTSGTVKAILPRGAVVSVAVTPIAGADYSYALAVPLSQYLPDLGGYAADSARPGEALRFLVNDAPAAFRDANGITTDQFVIPAGGVGQAYRLDPTLVGPESYPLGDVNANGVRNSADALLILKYDVGLIAGDTNFPPAPGKIYLPLCDIVQDGKCNSSDALRVLQCDVQMPGVSCPSQALVAAGVAPAAPDDANAAAFRLEISRAAAADQIVVRVRGGDPQARLSAAALDLRFAADRWMPDGCTVAASGLDGGYCNPTFGTGQARLAVVAAAGLPGDQLLAELTLRPRDGAARPTDADLRTAFDLAVAGAYDGAGEALGWRVQDAILAPSGDRLRIYLPIVLGGGPAAPASQAAMGRRIYLPIASRQ